MLLATFFFAVMNVFVKELTEIPAMEIVFFRCLTATIICGVGVARIKVNWLGNNRLLLVLRGSFGTAALFTFFLTVQNMPLASAVTIQYLAPIFTTIIAVFLLGERVGAIQSAFYATAFAGVFVLKGFDPSVSTVYLLLGIFSAVCSGAAYNLVRRLKEREHPLVVVLHFQLVGMVVGLICCLFYWKTPQNLWEWFCLLMTGVLTQAGQVCLTKSLQAAPIASVSILNYTGLIYALLFGWLIFGEQYNLQTLLGIAIVAASVVCAVLSARKPIEIIDENTAG